MWLRLPAVLALTAIALLEPEPLAAQTCPESFGTHIECTGAGGQINCSRCGSGTCYRGCHPDGFPDFCTGRFIFGEIETCPQGPRPACDNPQPEDFLHGDEGRPMCACLPIRRNVPDVPNGIDDDCDGVVDDEECDGIDNDANGFVDDARGSCLARVLTIPFCWDGDASQTSFSDEVSEPFFRMGLRSCQAPTGGLARKFFHEQDADDLLSGSPLCADFRAGRCDSVFRHLTELAIARHGEQKLMEFDNVAFFTNQDLCGSDRGAQEGGLLAGRNSPYSWSEYHAFGEGDGRPGVFAHELGHVLGLGEEYCSLAAANRNESPACSKVRREDFGYPNFLGGDLGCDVGARCCDFFKDCDPIDLDPDGIGSFCCGNVASRAGNFDRCIMSYINAHGDDRGFCARCAAWLSNPLDPAGLPYRLGTGEPSVRWNEMGIRGRVRDASAGHWTQLARCPTEPAAAATTCLADNGEPCNGPPCASDSDCLGQDSRTRCSTRGYCVTPCNSAADCAADAGHPICSDNDCVRERACTNSRGQVPLDCRFEHQGIRKVLSLPYRLEPDGRVLVRSFGLFQGRLGLGAQATNGRYRLELADEQGRRLAAVGADPFGLVGAIERHERLLVPEAVESAVELRFKLRAFKDGLMKSDVTLGGAPPVAEAGPDRVLECQGAGSASVSLDGSGSSDPDGDLVSFYEWSSSRGQLEDPRSATPTGHFPLGASEVSLTVNDGLNASAADTATVTVRDTVAPSASCAGASRECTGALTPVDTSCTATDACDTAPSAVSDARPAYGLGTHSFTCSATDAAGNRGTATCQVRITDTSPPQLTLPARDVIRACHSDPQAVSLPVPAVTEGCSGGQTSLRAMLVAVNEKPVSPPVPLGTGQGVVLPVGELRIRWEAEDASGNIGSAEQRLTVSVADSTACCQAGQAVIEGTENQDSIVRTGSAAYCVLGHGGGDFVQTAAGADRLLGGSGADALTAGTGGDAVFAGPGSDNVSCGADATLEAHGEADADSLHAVYCRAAELWGGTGDDHLVGSPGPDRLVPGPGRDAVSAGAGDDTVVLHHVCEATSGETLDGGTGSDTLVTPVPVSDLRARGVTVTGFERVVVDGSKRHLSPCF